MAPRKRLQYQQLAFVPVVVAASTFVITSALSSPVHYKQRFIYQSHTEPVFVPPQVVTEGSFVYPWSEPVRLKQGLAPQQQQTYAAPVFVAETVTSDKWYQAFSEPVRQKVGLKSHLQQPFIATTLDPNTQITQNYESRWHQPWSEPKRFKPQLPAAEQQFIAFTSPVIETITEDKWHQPWSEPTRRRGINTAVATSGLISPTITDEHCAFQFDAFQFSAFQVCVVLPQWEQPWTQLWNTKRLSAAVSASSGGVLTPVVTETVTVDKWFKDLSEPKRFKLSLGPHLQQFIAQVVLTDRQITDTYESRWHQPWTEPVRFRRFPTAGQQAFALGVPSFEIITVDKWVYPWSEPVRQKIGQKAHLQQSFIGVVLNPETQITQNYESRWHQPWSEPVRFRRFAASQQQFLAAPSRVLDNVTPDKWIYAWSEPVRQKVGLKVYLQQAFIAPTLNPDTQITQGYESRWHYAWSEPVRLRRFPTAEQQAFAAPPTSVFETVTVDKWVYPWSSPVRFRIDPRRAISLAAPFIAGPVLNPDTQITQNYESRWHQPWSEPRRFKRGLGAWLQQSATLHTPPFPNFITTINWYAALSEPVRQPQGFKVWLQPFLALYPRTAGVPDVIVTLSATEINSDSAFFGISEYKPAHKANVSIEEIPDLRRGNLSIEELDP